MEIIDGIFAHPFRFKIENDSIDIGIFWIAIVGLIFVGLMF